MIGRFAQRRRGRTGISSFQVYSRRPCPNPRTQALNQHSILTTSKGSLSNATSPSGSVLFRFPPYYHSFCTQPKTETETSSAKSDPRPTRQRLEDAKARDKALKSEADTYVEFLENTKGKGGFLFEKSKLSLKPELGFCGKIFIDLGNDAIHRAATIVEENTDQCHFICFVDGSLCMGTDAESGSRVIRSGAAVVYKPPGPNQPWVERYFAPPKCERNSNRIEAIAILDGLKIAAVVTDLYDRCHRGGSDDAAANIRVTISSDSARSLWILEKLQGHIGANSLLLGDPIVRELIAVSQYLQGMGVELELHWVRGHSNVKGNVLADGAARYAAKHPGISSILEKLLEVNVEGSFHTTGARILQRNKPSRGERKKKKKTPPCERENPATIREVQDLSSKSVNNSELQDSGR